MQVQPCKTEKNEGDQILHIGVFLKRKQLNSLVLLATASIFFKKSDIS